MMQKTLLHLLALAAVTQAWQAPLRRVPQLHAPARLAAPRGIDAFAAALAAAAPALAAAAPARAADASGGDVAGAYVARDAAPELRPRRRRPFVRRYAWFLISAVAFVKGVADKVRR